MRGGFECAPPSAVPCAVCTGVSGNPAGCWVPSSAGSECAVETSSLRSEQLWSEKKGRSIQRHTGDNHSQINTKQNHIWVMVHLVISRALALATQGHGYEYHRGYCVKRIVEVCWIRFGTLTSFSRMAWCFLLSLSASPPKLFLWVSSSLSSLSWCSSISDFSLFSRAKSCFWCCLLMRLYPDICSLRAEPCSCSCIWRVTCAERERA